ncbi:MAG TPA: bacillithiol biosynthesis cysteine-adding enzyme BshC [Chitinophagaceae bacterium]|nr:bacillithiol biosynthesis cysteine-adding enzyme BshC [Chitinophagaceae bacterium]
MDCTSTRLPYKHTNSFSKILTDYVDQSPALKPFYKHEVSIEGIKAAIAERKSFENQRELLVGELMRQYSAVKFGSQVARSIEKLRNASTFTITTAHQPNIFTGPLYFIYKIIHAIKLADHLSKELSEYEFVPVFYMGSEDADLAELNHISINGEKLVWDTKQSGAVGRMNTKGLETLIDRIEGELGVQPHGKEIVSLLKKCYLESDNVQNATFKIINELFGEYGLIVLIADNPQLKSVMRPVFEKDILEKEPSRIVDSTISQLTQAGMKVQANPRSINLFYLKDDLRERFTENGTGFHVHNTDLKFSKEDILTELEQNPQHFSPNVILRGLYQETILPNVAFIGGGGELSYWLELKDLFEFYNVPFPVLIVRNSFLIVDQKWNDKIERLCCEEKDLFKAEHELLTEFVKRQSKNELTLDKERDELKKYYEDLRETTGKVDKSLLQHIAALEKKAMNKLEAFEKKLIRAEKRKYAEEQKIIQDMKAELFPNNGLQERAENFMSFYSRTGKKFIECLYQHSPTLEQEFVILRVH